MMEAPQPFLILILTCQRWLSQVWTGSYEYTHSISVFPAISLGLFLAHWTVTGKELSELHHERDREKRSSALCASLEISKGSMQYS